MRHHNVIVVIHFYLVLNDTGFQMINFQPKIISEVRIEYIHQRQIIISRKSMLFQ